LTDAEYCDAVAAEVRRLSEILSGADLETPVPTCPPWNLAELVKHVGSIHHWAGRMVENVAQERLSWKELDLELPADPSGYPAWFTAGGEQLVTRLRTSDPNAPMWAWGADHHARFWARRMTHETGMHRADAELTLGREPSFEPAIASDGIDEFLENLPEAAYFAPNVKELRGDGETIHFHATDADGEWLIELTPESFSWQHGHGKGSAAVRGTASDLLLLTYGRRKHGDGRFEAFGDSTVLDRWFANAHI
jgi:uncharacterized protein (TIGR03083 family)